MPGLRPALGADGRTDRLSLADADRQRKTSTAYVLAGISVTAAADG